MEDQNSAPVTLDMTKSIPLDQAPAPVTLDMSKSVPLNPANDEAPHVQAVAPQTFMQQITRGPRVSDIPQADRDAHPTLTKIAQWSEDLMDRTHLQDIIPSPRQSVGAVKSVARDAINIHNMAVQGYHALPHIVQKAILPAVNPDEVKKFSTPQALKSANLGETVGGVSADTIEWILGGEVLKGLPIVGKLLQAGKGTKGLVALGKRALTSGAENALLGGTQAAVKSEGEPTTTGQGALLGAAFGAGGEIGGTTIDGVLNKAKQLLDKSKLSAETKIAGNAQLQASRLKAKMHIVSPESNPEMYKAPEEAQSAGTHDQVISQEPLPGEQGMVYNATEGRMVAKANPPSNILSEEDKAVAKKFNAGLEAQGSTSAVLPAEKPAPALSPSEAQQEAKGYLERLKADKEAGWETHHEPDMSVITKEGKPAGFISTQDATYITGKPAKSIASSQIFQSAGGPGQGMGSRLAEDLAAHNRGQGDAYLFSDAANKMSDEARGMWQKLQRMHPDEISVEPGGRYQWDLQKPPKELEVAASDMDAHFAKIQAEDAAQAAKGPVLTAEQLTQRFSQLHGRDIAEKQAKAWSPTAKFAAKVVAYGAADYGADKILESWGVPASVRMAAMGAAGVGEYGSVKKEFVGMIAQHPKILPVLYKIVKGFAGAGQAARQAPLTAPAVQESNRPEVQSPITLDLSKSVPLNQNSPNK